MGNVINSETLTKPNYAHLGVCAGMINWVECVQVNVVCNMLPMAHSVLSTQLSEAHECVHMCVSVLLII